jgi:O-antigen/teichoic acid export membrane protein
VTSTPANETPGGDLAALAKGGRTNFVGFLLRLVARLPFLVIGGRFYGAEALGRYASALVVIELTAMLCTMGEKRGLAQRLSNHDGDPGTLVADGLTLALLFGSIAALVLWLVPAPMFPSGHYTEIDRLIVLAIPALAMTEILLAAQAYRFDVGATVRARAIVEPWTISIMAGALLFVEPVMALLDDRATGLNTENLEGPAYGLSLAYMVSIYAALLTAAWPFLRTYGFPRGWRPSFERMGGLMGRGMPLAAADAIEWGTRRLDVFILGLFAAPSAVGVYYVAQQVASLPQKLKTSFEPILGPVLTRKLREKDYAAIAKQVCQVGFWITAAQAGVGLALGIPGEAIMGLAGPHFIGGTGALGFLLAAEVVAATAVVAEAALIYVARIRNLWVSIGTIALQAGLTVTAMLIAERLEFNDGWRAASAAAALMLALGMSSLIKAVMLSRILGHKINNWRWALVWAAAAAIIVGQAVILLPEWAELAFGIPVLLGVYGWLIWTRGFGPEDRVLFTRKVTEEAPAEPAGPGDSSRP